MSNDRHFTKDEVEKLKNMVNVGVQVEEEIALLKEGLKETVKDVSEECEIKVSQLNRLIKVARKQSLDEEKGLLDEIEDLLDVINSNK